MLLLPEKSPAAELRRWTSDEGATNVLGVVGDEDDVDSDVKLEVEDVIDDVLKDVVALRMLVVEFNEEEDE